MGKERAERATRYRQLADEIRNAAEGMQSESRQGLLQLANDYDLLADKLDLIDARTL
jgi:hypothetical protein